MRLWLKRLRESHNLTQKQVANFIGVTRTGYCMIESGDRQKDLNLSTMVSLSKLFKVPVEKLIEEENALKNSTN